MSLLGDKNGGFGFTKLLPKTFTELNVDPFLQTDCKL